MAHKELQPFPTEVQYHQFSFRVALCLCAKPSLRAETLLCYPNSFLYERFCRRTRFETEARDKSEMAYYNNASIYMILKKKKRVKTLSLFSSLTALSTARLDFSWPNFSDSGMKFISLIFYAVVSLAINKVMSVLLMNEELKQRKRCHYQVPSRRRASKLKDIRAAVFNKPGLRARSNNEHIPP